MRRPLITLSLLAVWAIPRENDRYKEFNRQYAHLGAQPQWADMEDREYLALFRLSKDSFTMLYG